MRCATCDGDSTVLDSRVLDTGAVRRRRACLSCGVRWTTYELRAPDHVKAVDVSLTLHQEDQ